MNEDPYRWLEAIQNRREYIRDQLKGGSPVFAVSRPEGILLMGVGIGRSKVFEIYDSQGMAALGHPVDIEKIRQSVIEAAHVEGFTRSHHDVTLRRLISFALSPMLKNSFEQIFSPPLIVESIFAEVGTDEQSDKLVRVNYDGNFFFENRKVLCAYGNYDKEKEAENYLRDILQPTTTIEETATHCLTAISKIIANDSTKPVEVSAYGHPALENRRLECALLDRKRPGRVKYVELDLGKNA
ncbi:MAG: hypothetical protein SGI71_11560 [Verrucomicrobiota bacterium]|nr:hypothetical protein [Verrucomicrobiota bacterium]